MKSLKITLFVFLFIILWIPFVQQLTSLCKEPVLKGAFIKPVNPEFSLDSLRALKFQKHFEDYQNYSFGFRPLFVKIKNTINYILFKELSIVDNVAGKDGFIFSLSSVKRTVGINYNGKNKNDSSIQKINFLKEGLLSHGSKLICVLVPSKESLIPESLLAPYNEGIRPKNDYSDIINGYKNNNIPFIDFCKYFRLIKDTCRYELTYKTGSHWSVQGASYAQDSLLHYIQKIIAKEIPSYKRIGVEISDTALDFDADFEGPLNMLFNLGQNKYIYPKLEINPNSKSKYRPKVIVIGDSFFWQLRNERMLMHIFSDDSKFWYYFSTSVPMGDAAWGAIKDLDVIREMESADCVVLMGSIATLDLFPFGVTNYYYNNCTPPEILAGLNSGVRCISPLMQKLSEKAKTEKTSLDALVDVETRKIGRDKMKINLIAANGKFVCADGGKNNFLIADRTFGGLWETFYMERLDNDQVCLYSYANKFFSAELVAKGEITASRNQVGGWETFSLVNLPDGFVAFKASNGKYLSVDAGSRILVANGNSVGSNEKFKLICVK